MPSCTRAPLLLAPSATSMHRKLADVVMIGIVVFDAWPGLTPGMHAFPTVHLLLSRACVCACMRHPSHFAVIVSYRNSDSFRMPSMQACIPCHLTNYSLVSSWHAVLLIPMQNMSNKRSMLTRVEANIINGRCCRPFACKVRAIQPCCRCCMCESPRAPPLEWDLALASKLARLVLSANGPSPVVLHQQV
jgi:hypothetical protein